MKDTQVHNLKTIQPFFTAIIQKRKRFEVRRDDRDFQQGDILILQEYDLEADTYSGAEQFAIITYKLGGGKFGIENGFCVLGIQLIDQY